MWDESRAGNFWLHLREIKRQRDVIVADDLVK